MNDIKMIDETPVHRHTGLICKALVLMALFFVMTLQLPVDAHAQVFNSVGVPMTGPNDRCGEEIWSLLSTPPGPTSHGTFLAIFDPILNESSPFPLVPADCANPTPDSGRRVANSYDSAYGLLRNWTVPNPKLFNLQLRHIPVPHGTRIRAQIPLPGGSPPNPLPATITRPTDLVTLGRWLSATGTLTSECNAFKSTLSLTMTHLVPNGVYTVWGIWTDTGDLPPTEAPLGGLPNTLVPDRNGNAQYVRDLDFCLPQTAPNGKKLQYISIAYHADGATYGSVLAEPFDHYTFLGLRTSPPFQSTLPLGAVTFPHLGFHVGATGGPDSAPPTTPGPALDTTAPVFTPPLAVTLEATSPSGAPAAYSIPAATDNVDPNPMVDCSPAIGVILPIGAPTTVTCTATDTTGNTSTTSFLLTVEDTTAPVIAATANITEEAIGPMGAIISYTPPTATDLGVAIGVTCLPVSGNILHLGTTPVTCTATDANGAVVSYTPPTAMDLVHGMTAVGCVPTSGSTFPIGATTVECTATDTSLNTTVVHFDITVQGSTPRTIKADAVAALIVLRDAETDPRLLEDFNKAIDDVNNSLSPVYWDGFTLLQQKNLMQQGFSSV